MPDKYAEKQLQNYENAKCEAAKDDALYRLGTHLEVLPCDGNANLNPEQRDTVLDAAKGKGDKDA
jgi:hypothetical protein